MDNINPKRPQEPDSNPKPKQSLRERRGVLGGRSLEKVEGLEKGLTTQEFMMRALAKSPSEDEAKSFTKEVSLKASSGSGSSISSPFIDDCKSSWFTKTKDFLSDDSDKGDRLTPIFSSGTSGSYFATPPNSPERIALVKVLDQEPGAEHARNDGRREIIQGKRGVTPGTSGLREAITHKIFPAITPEVVIAEISSVAFIQDPDESPIKLCAVQQLIGNDGDTHALSPSEEAELKPLLPKIIYIDLMLANADRNRGNLLVQKTDGHITDLIPIDHGYVLPDNFLSGGKFCWYRMVDETDFFSPHLQAMIKSFDLEGAHSIIESKLLDPIAAQNTLSVSVLLTQKLCSDVSMKEIGMYHFERPNPKKEDLSDEGEVLSFLNEKSLCHAILKLAALSQNPSAIPSKDVKEFLNPTHIASTIERITTFIKGEKVFAEDLVASAEDKDRLIYSNKETSEMIHIAHRITREVLSEYIQRNDREGLLSYTWHAEVHRRIEAELKASG
jgi:hypothetical protein